MILCCGEALIDMLPSSDMLGRKAYVPVTGGAALNTAIALGRLGTPVGLFTGLSSDPFGQMIISVAADEGVDTAPSAIRALPTTLAFVHLLDGRASYSFHDENSAGRMLAVSDIPDTSAACYLFGGISLAAEPCGAVYEAFQARASESSLTMLDLNIRPALINDEAAYRARLDRMITRADIVKISDEDLDWLVGPGDMADQAQKLLDMGPKLVLLTMDSRGARGFGRCGTRVSVAALHVPHVVDTVGAGDTFNAGTLAALYDAGLLTKDAIATLSAEDLHAAMLQGTRAAGYCVAQAGANGPTRAQLCAL
ncbi:carbohydrate kinase family protein [Ketogulonicigenium vulgare]|uniref:Carbohydrate kinase, PfkB n=1 Tax=Ketogulonicigenium vulgare (strain WSH-001) TaxID=759362 RepID=F9YAJ7_KETVW|nr:carbohydrate kinase [Ketogulonicigenium vulgare]ADO43234.1 ribokinase-like domain-containing protein [Ketogulonicigenium vulgare Y25]AEM41528.1 Carbohydrate kinase, PfkB [Ketogulonicigenium vulgare WSH-001]ALJ82384.1 carbohydrate kinase [Ketogulonicigenium vulgare]ANW35147.1 carbohydrate kinase [Ketogulonicigenium vulgare]AOZ55270.1 ribokinase-like domain-containing protein [Ketogulonicigenium vulgare]